MGGGEGRMASDTFMQSLLGTRVGGYSFVDVVNLVSVDKKCERRTRSKQ